MGRSCIERVSRAWPAPARIGFRGHGPLLHGSGFAGMARSYTDRVSRAWPAPTRSGFRGHGPLLHRSGFAGMARSYTDRVSRAWPAPTRIGFRGHGPLLHGAGFAGMARSYTDRVSRAWPATRIGVLQQQYERIGPRALPVRGLHPRDRLERSCGCRQPPHRDVRRRERAGGPAARCAGGTSSDSAGMARSNTG